jgi:hypothetical protein
MSTDARTRSFTLTGTTRRVGVLRERVEQVDGEQGDPARARTATA